MQRVQNSFVLIIGIVGVFVAGNEPEPGCPPIVSRAEWSARPPKAITYTPFPVDKAIIIHTATPQCTTPDQCTERVRSTQQFHMAERNFNDIGYTFLIGGDGRIYEGVGWHKTGAHTRGYNSNSLGIAFIGNFEDVLPSDAMMNALRNLLTCGVQQGELKRDYKLLGHRQLISTISPGKKLYEALQKMPNWAASV
ncbi:hypothetical protein J437_LFUL014142 [Ladona fulva]|uniref:Peptidoglycan-recognition protein n=1 Tax=Ladona fulva TaxID=123851 RepID=A0A8K0K0L7_LADFU|nr:hypothetical protein J437_LFUL014142 [Ladona fulva]